MYSQVQFDLLKAQSQEFLETVREKCFKVCITKPGSNLSSSETTCLNRCVDRYIEATQAIAKSIQSKAN